MLDRLIRFSLANRLLVVALAALVVVYGTWVVRELPIDVFPDLNRPTVTIFTEAGQLSPEEVELQVTWPIETAVNGAPGVERVRSTSGVGLSIVHVEFGWGSDVYRDRQVVSERLQLARERLPDEVSPVLAPVSSIMGEILLLGLASGDAATSPEEIRSLADWVVRPRLLTVPGVSQVTVLGGAVREYQALVDPARLLAHDVSLDDVVAAARGWQANTSGGFVTIGPREYLVRNHARTSAVDELASVVVAAREPAPIALRQVAEVRLGTRVRRGDAGMNGEPAVILAVQKQPGASSIDLTRVIARAMDELRPGLPADLTLEPLFVQAEFIEAAVRSVVEALRDGSILVVVVLLLFLMSFRTTAITLTAIPVSLLVTAMVLEALGLTVNTMTLGGLAIAIGELVDDAIVDVENVFRRLRENRERPDPLPALTVVFRASSEVRNSIVFATAAVILVFAPLFALSGIEGRLFAPLGVAYITSIVVSLVVSLTLTPVLCSYLLAGRRGEERRGDGAFVRWLKRHDERLLGWTLDRPWRTLVIAAALVLAALLALPFLGREFMPPFNEGTATINVYAPPGTSLEESNRIGRVAERLLLEIPEVRSVGRRTGRAEQDEHAEGVHSSEIDVDFREGHRPRPEVLADVRERLALLPGVRVNVGQPISHRLDHLLSGVRAQIAVKVFGPDLDRLRAVAAEVEAAMRGVAGIVDLQVENPGRVPELGIRVRAGDAARHGARPGDVAAVLAIAFEGEVVGRVIDGQRSHDVRVRYRDQERRDLEALRQALVEMPSGAWVPVSAVADVGEEAGPNNIQREALSRRIAVLANVQGRDLGGTVEAVRRRIAEEVALPAGYAVAYEGQFQSQQSASRRIAFLALASLAGLAVLLYGHFRSLAFVLQILVNIPLALVGAVAAVLVTDRTLSVATLVGFITLCGIASRNTIMLISHYLHLMREEGESFSREMIVRGSLERLSPVLMTALTAGLALVPLALARGEPGKEILAPVATVILGGLVSSTLLDLAVTPAAFWLFGRRAARRHVEG